MLFSLAIREWRPSHVLVVYAMQERHTKLRLNGANVVVFAAAVFTEAPFRGFGKLSCDKRVRETFDVREHVTDPFFLHPEGLVNGFATEFQRFASTLR